MNTVTSDHRSARFSALKEPALRVQPGEIVRVETSPVPGEQLFSVGEDWVHVDLDTFISSALARLLCALASANNCG